MKWAITITLILLLAGIARAVVISQVLYNPEGTESGGEAIEIHNNENSDIDISGWTIKTEASDIDAAIPQNTILCSSCYYLIADSGWNTSRDNLSWPLADHEEPINLYNTNSGIALVNNNTIIDAVGWGDPSEIDEGLFESEPAVEADEGFALLREDDTGSSYLDFSSRHPSFRSSSDLGTGTSSDEISMTMSAGTPASVQSINISPDEGFGSGIQVYPNPGGAKTVTIKAYVEGEVGEITASFLNTTKAMVFQESIYASSFELGHGLPPGTYNITINIDGKESYAEFEYMELVSVSLSGSIDLNDIEAGSTAEAEITVHNIGNAYVDIGISATHLMGESGAISQKNIEYSLGDKYYAMSSNTQIRKASLAPGNSKGISLRFNVPETADGEYTGTLTVIGVGTNN